MLEGKRMAERQPPFKRLLVANRGEIAIRILRAATELGIRTVAMYSHEDRFSLYRFKADEAYKIGTPGQPIATYLDIPNIIESAKSWGIDAIHPGYGFLSESAVFAEECLKANIKFVGPAPKVLAAFGDKVISKRMALEAQIPTIPGTSEPVATLADARMEARRLGYPVTLKAVSGGGGKGIRMIRDEAELEEAFARAQSEATTSFGRADVYLEKTVVNPKHVEVQILGDEHGQLVHLFERDCSIQRRHQKVVEVAPALGISDSLRETLCHDALKLGRYVDYSGLGTVEFLVGEDGQHYFLEVNPRVQVEHTVTEMITGIDLVQASILVAAGESLSHPNIGIRGQESVKASGAAIQCRVTTEDPTRNFAPDTGEIIAFRPGSGFGIRLDEGQATAGGVVTPFYDSLLVKVIAWAPTLDQAAAKMHRSLSEFRIRGLRHNVPLLKNVVRHPEFLSSRMTTHFFETHRDVFQIQKPRDRATRILRYLAEVTVNNPHDLSREAKPADRDAPLPEFHPSFVSGTKEALRPTPKEIFDREGATGLKKWLMTQNRVQVTDTTMRDAHQSLFATRLRTRDILRVAPFYRDYGQQFFSLEVWGGATFDTALRFLKEDPWERLTAIREKIPNALLQMLLRGDNAVGYTNYPSWVIRDFIKQTVKSGLDLFRIFDCLNQPEKMAVAIEAVKHQGAIAEVCLCYTGNLASPQETKYDVGYYTKIAKEVAAMGADLICIKDMAGLLRPRAARILIDALRNAVDLPVHLHMHDTAGAGVATLIEAAKAGCHIVDGAISSMAGFTSQPSINALVAAMDGDPRAPDLNLSMLNELALYWEAVKGMYKAFDPGISSTSTDVYEHEIPGGQYSNLVEQARKVGVSAKEFHDLTKRYKEVNELFGNIVKVTPSSKVVGDMALLLQKHGLTGPEYLQKKPKIDYPDSVVGFFKGHLGVPYGGFPKEVRELVLGTNPPPPAPPEITENDSFASVHSELSAKLGREITSEEVLSYRLYPKVFLDYIRHQEAFGDVSHLTTPVFFYGLSQGQEIETDIEAGKTLVISLKGISAPNPKGVRTVFFDLNGFPREVEVRDESLAGPARREKADPMREGHVGAPMPGKVLNLGVRLGDSVATGDKLLVTESMKMEYVITAKLGGTISRVMVAQGDMVEGGDLLIEIT
jgi:pyruvate carboxylase